MKSSEEISNEFYKKLGAKGLSEQVSMYRAKGDIQLVKHLAKKTDTILDLACGYGRVTIPMKKAGYNITGIDLAPNLIQEARRQAVRQKLDMRFDIGSMTKLPYPSESFDTIFCLWSSFNHLLTAEEQLKALNEIHRVLKPGGLAFIEMFNAEKKKIREKLKKEGQGPDKRLWGEVFNGSKNLDYMHSRETMRKICKESNFVRFKVGFKNWYNGRRIVAELFR